MNIENSQDNRSLNPVESITFIYNKNNECLLAQVICIPNVIKYNFMGPLKQSYLDDRLIYKIFTNQSSKKLKENSQTQKEESSYHLIRIAQLSSAFHMKSENDVSHD